MKDAQTHSKPKEELDLYIDTTVIIAPKPSYALSIAKTLSFNDKSIVMSEKGYFFDKRIYITWDLEDISKIGDIDWFISDIKDIVSNIDDVKKINKTQLSIVKDLIKKSHKVLMWSESKEQKIVIRKGLQKELIEPSIFYFYENYGDTDSIKKELQKFPFLFTDSK